VKWLVIALVFAAAIYGTAYVMRRPESNCANSNVSELWASDHAYKATLIKKDCNMGEALIFSVRIDAYAPPLTRAWFTPGYELDNDSYPEGVPELRWSASRQLDIAVSTRTLVGTLTRHAGDDLSVVIRYVPREPAAFPNY
jgi:hypothetical protein